MTCYVWKRGDKIVAYKCTSEDLPPPAIKISTEEAKALGICVSPVFQIDPEIASQASEPTAEEDLLEMALDHEFRLTMLELGI